MLSSRITLLTNKDLSAGAFARIWYLGSGGYLQKQLSLGVHCFAWLKYVLENFWTWAEWLFLKIVLMENFNSLWKIVRVLVLSKVFLRFTPETVFSQVFVITSLLVRTHLKDFFFLAAWFSTNIKYIDVFFFQIDICFVQQFD